MSLIQSSGKYKRLLAILAVVFGSFPQWAQAVWAIFSNQPLAAAIGAGLAMIPPLSIAWLSVITWPIALYFLWQIFRSNRPAHGSARKLSEEEQESNDKNALNINELRHELGRTSERSLIQQEQLA